MHSNFIYMYIMQIYLLYMELDIAMQDMSYRKQSGLVIGLQKIL